MKRASLYRAAGFALALAAVAGGGWQRIHAARELPPDYDELVYIPAAYRYAARLSEQGIGALRLVLSEFGHPPLVKLITGVALTATKPPEPDWSAVRPREPTPEAARPAFAAARRPALIAGTLQLALLAMVNPLAALLVAFDSYHAKYTALAMLEAIPGLFALLAVILLERGLRASGRRQDVLVLLSASALGAAAAGKYPYGFVLAFVLAPFVLHAFRRRLAFILGWALVVGVSFLALSPNLWVDPWLELRDVFDVHWGFSRGEHVRQSAFPWWAPLYFLTHPEPTLAHPGVFLTGVTSYLLLPLAALGFPRAWRRHRVFAVWALVGLAFLLSWSTKWPHYLLLVLPALAVCAAEAPGTLLSGLRRIRAQRAHSTPG